MEESKTEVENVRILTEEEQRQNDKEACILDSAISEKNGEMEVLNVEKEQKIQELLKSINDEASQLNGFLIEESKLIHEICTSLKYVLNELHVCFSIPPPHITFQKKARKVVLNEDVQLTITDENGETRSIFLAECAPETIMAVLWNVMPELKRTMMTYRKKVGTRVNFFKRLKTELKSIARIITGKEENQSSSEEQVIEVEGNSTNDENKS